MNYYLGIDVGTTSTKAVAFSEQGKVLESYSFEYAIHHPQPGYSEQNPEDIWEAVLQGIEAVTKKMQGNPPRFAAFVTAMHSLIVVNEKDELLTPCIIWADARAADTAKRLKASPEGKKLYEATGVPIHSMSPLCKILWLKEAEPQLFQQAAKFIGIKEYLFFKLFGTYESDTAIASATGLLNLQTGQWDEAVLQFAGIRAGQLPGLTSVYQQYRYTGNHPQLQALKATPIIAGGSDGALSNIGAGATEPSQMAVNIGTSSAARVLLTAPETDEQMRTFCYFAKPGRFIVGGASNNGAVVLQWLKEDVLRTEKTFDELFALAETVPAGSDGLLLLPFIMGERAPIWEAAAKAVFFGMTSQHTQAHFVRAAMEGVIYAVYSIGKVVLEKHPVTTIYASGGFAKSGLWLQMLADVLNTKVSVSDASESTALGAVVLGAEALQLPLQVVRNDAKTYEPDAANGAIYQAGFAKYERLYQLLKGEM